MKTTISELSMQTEPVKASPGEMHTYNNEPVEIMSVAGNSATVRDSRGAVKTVPAAQLKPAEQIQEVEMNPSSFAAAIEQGDVEKVLVGFEFEVLVPESAIAAVNTGPVKVSKSQMQEGLLSYMVNRSAGDYNNEEFDKMVKIKAGAAPAADMASLTKLYFDQIQETTRKLFMQLPEYTRARANKHIKRKLQGEEMTFPIYLRLLKGFYYEYMRDIPSDERRVFAKITEIDGSPELFTILEKTVPGLREGNFMNFLEFDTQTVARFLQRNDFLDTGESDGYYDDDFPGAVRVLKPAIEQTIGKKVHVFSEYHEKKKNLTDWYIEPDGSLSVDGDGDGSAEVVTPPMLAKEAVDTLGKFYGMAKNLGLYTNSSTGLHINVSIPKKIDLFKLAVFLGDQYVLKAFGREASEYATSVLKSLSLERDTGAIYAVPTGDAKQKNVFGQRPVKQVVDFKILNNLITDLTDDHTASISNNGKYISFRHAGGDYLSAMNKIVNTVGRFIRAMLIASDKNAYRQEYLTKLTKLMGNQQSELPDMLGGRGKYLVDLLRYIRKNGGVPVVDMVTFSEDRYDDRNIKNEISHIGNIYGDRSGVLKSGDTAKQILSNMIALSPGSNTTSSATRYLEQDTVKSNSVKFNYYQFVPTSITSLNYVIRTRASEVNGVWARYNMLLSSRQILPITDPRVRALIKELMTEVKKTRGSVREQAEKITVNSFLGESRTVEVTQSMLAPALIESAGNVEQFVELAVNELAKHYSWADRGNATTASLKSWHAKNAFSEGLEDPEDNPCWKGYHPVGTKKKQGRTVPNCVPNDK